MTAADTGRMGQRSADATSPRGPSGLGTGFVPESPEATAAQIAGTQAMAQAAQALAAAPALAAADAQSSGSTASDGQQSSTNASDSQQGQASQSSSLAASGGVSTGGPETENSETAAGELEMQAEAQGDSRTGTGDQDARIRQKEIVDQPWFARLPPSLRQAIQAQARQRPPRGYEERLRRYFEGAD
jgi:hypothetical protein